MMDNEKVPTTGAEFYDLRYQPVKLIQVLDIPEKGITYNAGDEINVAGSNGKVYGPYKLEAEFMRGGGKVVWKAYATGAAAKAKPMSKAELESALANLMAEHEKLKQAAATKHGK